MRIARRRQWRDGGKMWMVPTIVCAECCRHGRREWTEAGAVADEPGEDDGARGGGRDVQTRAAGTSEETGWARTRTPR